jgi:hypothetical protein
MDVVSAPANTDTSGPSTRDVPVIASAAAADGPGPDTTRPRPRRGRPPARVLGRALALVAAVFALVLLVPRPNSVPQETVDATAAARSAAARLGFTPAVPVGLAGWTATVADLRHGTSGILTWHLGLLTPTGDYAGVEQATTSSSAWEMSLSGGATPLGFVTIDGRSWEYLDKAERNTTTLILREPGRATLVTAKGGGLVDAETLVRALPPTTLTGPSS